MISAWISNHMPAKVWDEITCPFPNFNGSTIEVWEWMSNFIPHFITDMITDPYWDLSQSQEQDINGLMQKRHNSIAHALELHLYRINPSI